MKQLLTLLFLLVICTFGAKAQTIESVATGYYRAKVGDSILANRTTERKAKDDGFNYMAKHGMSGTYEILYPEVIKVSVVIPQIDTVYVEVPPIIQIDTVYQEVEVVVRDTTYIELPPIIQIDTVYQEVEVIVRDTTYVDRIEYIDRFITDTIYQDVEVIVRDTTYIDRIEYVDRIVTDTIYQDVEVIVRDTVTIKEPELLIFNSYMGPKLGANTMDNKAKVEFWQSTAAGNGSLDDFKSNIITKPVDSIFYINELKIPQTNPNLDIYGLRVTGSITPTVTGNYTFYCYADDELEFRVWQGNGEKVKLLEMGSYVSVNEWDKFPGQKSVIFPMVSGEIYNFEILTWEGKGGDYFGVGWTTPTQNQIQIIGGEVLSSFTQ